MLTSCKEVLVILDTLKGSWTLQPFRALKTSRTAVGGASIRQSLRESVPAGDDSCSFS